MRATRRSISPLTACAPAICRHVRAAAFIDDMIRNGDTAVLYPRARAGWIYNDRFTLRRLSPPRRGGSDFSTRYDRARPLRFRENLGTRARRRARYHTISGCKSSFGLAQSKAASVTDVNKSSSRGKPWFLGRSTAAALSRR